MKNKTIKGAIITLLLLFLYPSVTFAQVPAFLTEFVIQGNFDLIANTFLRIGLIASDNGYRGGVIAVIVLVIIGTGLGSVKATLMEGRQVYPWVNWIGSIAIGLAIYGAFVLNTSTFLVRDQTNNKFVTVTGIPDGIAFLALVGNKIEQGIIDIVETSATPSEYGDDYLSNPRGITFDAISKVFDGGVDLNGTGGTDANGSLNTSNIQNYIRDCFFYDINTPTTAVGYEDIDYNTDFVALLSNGANPAVNTIYHTNTSKAGITVTCQDSWDRLNSYFNSLSNTHPAVVRFFKERCAEAAFAERVAGAVGPNMEQQCKIKITGYIQNYFLGGAVISESALMKQYLVATEMHNVLLKEAPDTAAKYLANRSMGSRLVTAGVMAGQWMPLIKGMMFAVFLGASPFLMMLGATALYGRAISVMFGFSVFFICWGVSDALLHQYARDAAISVMESIVNGQLGLRSMLMFSSEAARAYACFAPYQLLAFMLAGVFSGSLVKFGGNAMSRLGMMQVQSLESVAGTTSHRVYNPAGVASTLEGLGGSYMPKVAKHNRYGFTGISRHGYVKEMTEHGTIQGVIDEFGGGNGAIESQVGANLNTIRGGVASAGAYGDEGKRTGMGTMGVHRREKGYDVGTKNKFLDYQEELHGNLNDMTTAGGKARDLQVNQTYAKSMAVDQKGGMDFLADTEGFGVGEASGRIDAGKDMGLSPDEAGRTSGYQSTTDTLIRSNTRSEMGNRVYSDTVKAGIYSSTIGSFENRFRSDIGKHGFQTPALATDIAKFKAMNPNAEGALSHMRIKAVPQAGTEAANWAKYMSGVTGQQVSAEDMAGADITMSMSPDNMGNLRTDTFEAVQGQSTILRDNMMSRKGSVDMSTAQAFKELTGNTPNDYAHRIFNPQFSAHTRALEANAFEEAAAGWLGKAGFKHQGSKTGSANYGGGFNIPRWVPGVKGGAEWTHVNNETEAISLFRADLNRIRKEALANDSPEDYYRTHTKEWFEKRREHLNRSSLSYGKSSTVGAIAEGMKLDKSLDDVNW